jgi:hypothetical protein
MALDPEGDEVLDRLLEPHRVELAAQRVPA